jgi:hypothetical protein
MTDNNEIVSLLVTVNSFPNTNSIQPGNVGITIKRHKGGSNGDPHDFWYEREIPLSEILNIKRAYFSHDFDQLTSFRNSDFQRIPVVRDPGDTWEDPFVRRNDNANRFTGKNNYVIQLRQSYFDTLR